MMFKLELVEFVVALNSDLNKATETTSMTSCEPRIPLVSRRNFELVDS